MEGGRSGSRGGSGSRDDELSEIFAEGLKQAAKDIGEDWTETGLAFTGEHGRPIHAAKLTDAVRDIADQ